MSLIPFQPAPRATHRFVLFYFAYAKKCFTEECSKGPFKVCNSVVSVYSQIRIIITTANFRTFSSPQRELGTLS